MRTRWIIVAFAVVLTLLAGSCSSSSDTSAKSDDVESSDDSAKENGGGSSKVPSDICELLTLEDAEAAVGGLKLELDENLLGDDSCTYQGVEASDMVSVSLVYDGDSLENLSAEDYADLADSLSDDDEATKVEGVGDAAYALKYSTADLFLVVHGNDELTFQILGGPDDNVEAMTTLAKNALEKL